MAGQASTPFDQGLFLVHLNRGKEFLEQHNYAAAETELEQARRMRPTDEVLLNLLGVVYFKQEKYREADKVYSRLIELAPDSETLHFNQGLICFKLGSPDRAESAFLRTLELAPDNQKANFYLGNIYEKKGQYYNAIFQYRKAGANIMVKRVQAKIEGEREAKVASSTEPEPPEAERTLPPFSVKSGLPAPAEETAPPLPALTVNVDHLDKRRFLDALKSPPAYPLRSQPRASGPVLVSEPVTEEPSSPSELEIPPGPFSSEDTTPGRALASPPSAQRTVVELSEPVLQDLSLTELTHSKVLSTATPSLFASPPAPAATGGIPPSDADMIEAQRHPEERPAGAQTAPIRRPSPPEEEEQHAQLYSKLRRKDDIFRYVEDNLMEVNFSGKVFIKPGTIYSYSGNLTFWVKPPKHEPVSPLVIVSGTGKLLLSDRQREISVVHINKEEVFVNPCHLLACQETLTPRYAVIRKEGQSEPLIRVLAIEGTGMIALSVATKPLVLTVAEGFPVNAPSANVISWSGQLTPSIVDDDAFAGLMFPSSPQGVHLRLEGSGKVMMEKTSL